MTTLPLLKEIASPALVRSLGFALLHSLWQGGVLALLLAGVLPLLRRRRAEVRYAVAAGALASLLLSVGLTFASYYRAAPSAGPVVAAQVVAAQLAAPATWQPAAPVPAVTTPVASPAAPAAWFLKAQVLEAYLPLVVGAWLLGLLLMSGRLAGGLWYAGRLRRASTQALGAEWQQRLAGLARRAGVRRPVALLESVRVASPLVIGHLRPAILLPLGAVAGLSPALLEALLAHELAHIVRRDYLLNLGLAVAEVLFFYHPAVWFMAACLRAERENCCDDQAAALCGGDGLRVARALAALAELEAAPGAVPRLALAAAGPSGRGSLLARVRRLALGRPQAPTLGEGLLAGSLALLGLLGLSTGVVLAARPAKLDAARQTHPAAASPADTARRREAATPPPAAAAPAVAELPAAAVAPPAAPAPAAAPVPAVAEAPAVPPLPQQDEPPRRGRASTVVIEKDKKGRVVNLLVDGQPVETTPGKAGKRPKPVRQVEVVQVPAPAERLDGQSFGFGFSSSDLPERARRQARQGLAEALRDPGLNAEQRQQMERELQKLSTATKQWHVYADARLADLNRSLKTYRFDLKGFTDGDNYAARRNSHVDVRVRGLANADRAAAQAARDAEQAARDAEQATRDAEQADREAEQADRDAEQATQDAQGSAEAASRRAELRARMAADAAELRALDHEARLASPRAPRLPRVPRAPQGPALPQGPAVPPPPPAVNPAQLREELRRDGLIKNEKHFTFELTNEGGRADGRALTPAQVEKYRQLLNQPAGKNNGGRTKSTYSISVDER